MNRCPRCQSNNRDDSRFCTSCGTPFTPAANTASPVKSKNNPLVIGAIVLGVLLSCTICGIIGKLGDNPQNSSRVETATVKNTTALSQTPISTASPELAVNNAPRTLVLQPFVKSQTAIVITDNAGVFDAPKSDAKEIQKSTVGTNVEVIKQKAHGFMFRSTGRKAGCMAIRSVMKALSLMSKLKRNLQLKLQKQPLPKVRKFLKKRRRLKLTVRARPPNAVTEA